MKTVTYVMCGLAAVGIAGSASAAFYGDPLVEQTYASDFPVGLGGSAPVLVANPVVLPTGTLTSTSFH
jgi:hypothetical protein